MPPEPEVLERIGRLEGSFLELRKATARLEGSVLELYKGVDGLHRTITAWFTVISMLLVFLTAILPLIYRYLGVFP